MVNLYCYVTITGQQITTNCRDGMGVQLWSYVSNFVVTVSLEPGQQDNQLYIKF